MAKLVGSYKVVVGSVDVGKNKNGNDILKLGLKFTDEYVNNQFIEMNPQPMHTWSGSLKRDIAKNGKSPAQMTAMNLRNAFDFEGNFKDLHKLMFAQCIAVCKDHDDGNFTRIEHLNNLNDKNQGQQPLKEFTPDVVEELDNIFGSV